MNRRALKFHCLAYCWGLLCIENLAGCYTVSYGQPQLGELVEGSPSADSPGCQPEHLTYARLLCSKPFMVEIADALPIRYANVRGSWAHELSPEMKEIGRLTEQYTSISSIHQFAPAAEAQLGQLRYGDRVEFRTGSYLAGKDRVDGMPLMGTQVTDVQRRLEPCAPLNARIVISYVQPEPAIQSNPSKNESQEKDSFSLAGMQLYNDRTVFAEIRETEDRPCSLLSGHLTENEMNTLLAACKKIEFDQNLESNTHGVLVFCDEQFHLFSTARSDKLLDPVLARLVEIVERLNNRSGMFCTGQRSKIVPWRHADFMPLDGSREPSAESLQATLPKDIIVDINDGAVFNYEGRIYALYLDPNHGISPSWFSLRKQDFSKYPGVRDVPSNFPMQLLKQSEEEQHLSSAEYIRYKAFLESLPCFAEVGDTSRAASVSWWQTGDVLYKGLYFRHSPFSGRD